ncbi:hypothetical protein H072_3564 [Dactylellina haptotyla CBS 200.50]|uniref:Protein kinase domain-containing protein n=1 Tax=Dactylellina haptotyla (strain CBS 200.50) TaxID=1284197 RepID=S8BSK9_DACHA|nr:hypothetical protein H072_3564 [Dactylellina haptotyla CBS 200.50]
MESPSVSHAAVDLGLPAILNDTKIKTEFRRDGVFVHQYKVLDSRNGYRKGYWKTEKKLGGGTHGTTYLQKCFKGFRSGPSVRVIKIIPDGSKERVTWIRELETIMEFSHFSCRDNFVRPFGWFHGETSTFITMEYLELGDLGKFLREKSTVPEKEARDICIQLVCGIRYMHGRNFAHVDLKPSKIMIKSGPPRWWVKIGGLGSSKRSEEGTPAFMAPELLNIMLSGRFVFETGQAIAEYGAGHRDLPCEILEEKRCTSEAISFFSELLARNPTDRPTAEQGCSHPWIAKLQTRASPELISTGSELPELESLNLSGLATPGEWNQPSATPLDQQNRKLETDCREPIALITTGKEEENELEHEMKRKGSERSHTPELQLEDEIVSHNSEFQVAEDGSARYPTLPSESEIGQTQMHILQSEVLSHQGTEQFTDSGYASAGCPNCILQQKSKPSVHECPTTVQYLPVMEPVQDFEDVNTIYSDESSTEMSEKDAYLAELADVLFREVNADQLDIELLNGLSLVLPELLKAFALKVGHNSGQMDRDVMAFICRHRNHIVKYFKKRCHRDEDGAECQTTNAGDMNYTEKMDFWRDRTEYSPDFTVETEERPEAESPEMSADEEHTEKGFGEDIAKTEQRKIQIYRQFLSKTPAFEWLIGSLRRETVLSPTKPNSMDSIKNRIVRFLPSSTKVSKRESSETFRMVFTTDWNPLAFIDEQSYENEPSKAIERAITLTGSTRDAQALTCAQYLCQTWPSTGKYILQLVQDLLSGMVGTSFKRVLPDNTRVMVSLWQSSLRAEVFGTAHSIAEIGQQLAWLSSALRSSPRKVGVIAGLPSVLEIRVLNRLAIESTAANLRGFSCKLGFAVEDDDIRSPSNGQCWHSMFRNPVIVKGYPIPRRPNPKRGLEIPLNIMAGLARTQHLQFFSGKVFIKGLSTLLVPTRREKGFLVWHLIYNPEGGRISYLECKVSHEEVDATELETSRHVLGWCSRAEYNAGSKNANYGMKESGLPKPRGGYVLENTFITGRRIIVGGSQFSLGNRDTPFHISQEDPLQRLQWIDRKFFILWDEADKRGWLVNGASTLLHLLRKSLENNSTDKFRFECCFQKESMQEAPEKYKTFSAISVLRNDANLKQKIYPKKLGYLCVEDRLDELFDTLEKVVEHQFGIARQSTSGGNKTGEFLEGWDFNDLATNEDPIYPRLATFRKPSGGWVDFTRSIQAVTLFGRGFGEIIKSEGLSCAQWVTLPTGEYYLAAAVDDLKKIMKKNGDQYASPMRLTDDIFWHPTENIFEECKCISGVKGKHSAFVQATLSSSLCHIQPNNISIQLLDGGAVIFGHSQAVTSYDDSGNLQYEVFRVPSPHMDLDILSTDSGIGSSLSQSFRPSAMQSNMRSLTCEDYIVGIVCALPKELFAVRALFDRKHEGLTPLSGDINQYALGYMQPHNVVAACLPAGEYGTTAAASVYSHMIRSFPKLKFCLLVGIGGGVPSNGVRLGDVVVSHPSQDCPGVIEYDRGKALRTGFKRSGSLHGSPQFVMTAISNLTSDPDMDPQPLGPYLKKSHSKVGNTNTRVMERTH